jgi:hypothetical protein
VSKAMSLRRKLTLSITLALAVLVSIVYPFIYWLNHPELTQMQVWLDTLWFWGAGVLILLLDYLHLRD